MNYVLRHGRRIEVVTLDTGVAAKPKQPAAPFIGCPVSWFAWVLPRAKSKEQLALALYLYRRCCVCRSGTVTVPAGQLTQIGLGRWSKYKLLTALKGSGVVHIERWENGQAIKVRLVGWLG
jgi:hypothetical protein